jgi:hypothetical protein
MLPVISGLPECLGIPNVNYGNQGNYGIQGCVAMPTKSLVSTETRVGPGFVWFYAKF